MLEQSNFTVFFRDEGVVLEQINTSMTSIIIKSYLMIAIFRSFFEVLGAKKY